VSGVRDVTQHGGSAGERAAENKLPPPPPPAGPPPSRARPTTTDDETDLRLVADVAKGSPLDASDGLCSSASEQGVRLAPSDDAACGRASRGRAGRLAGVRGAGGRGVLVERLRRPGASPARGGGLGRRKGRRSATCWTREPGEAGRPAPSPRARAAARRNDDEEGGCLASPLPSDSSFDGGERDVRVACRGKVGRGDERGPGGEGGPRRVERQGGVLLGGGRRRDRQTGREGVGPVVVDQPRASREERERERDGRRRERAKE